MFKELIQTGREAKARRDERARPSGFEFALAQRISFLNPAHWDLLTENQTYFLNRGYLEVLEENGPSNVCQRYAMVYDQGVPVAAIAAQMVDITGTHLVKLDTSVPDKMARTNVVETGKRAILKRALAPLAKKAKGEALSRTQARMLVCGNMLSWGFHGVAFASDRESASLWPGVAEALYRIRRAERLAGQTHLIMVKDITPAEGNAVSILRNYSYRPMETEPNMVLTLDPAWNSFDDYLASLTASYRKAARKVIGDFDSSGASLQSWNAEQIGAHRHELHDLYVKVQSNASCRPVTFGPDFLPAMAEAAGSRFRCTAVLHEGTLKGFVTSLLDGTTSMGYYIGFDRSVNSSIPIYLRLLQVVLADAIECRATRLSLGRTALEPKARLGAVPEPISVWIRHRQPIANAILRELLRCVPQVDPPVRTPFK